MKLLVTNLALAYGFRGFRMKFGEPCPPNSDFNIFGRCICVGDAFYDEENNVCQLNEDYASWPQVAGYFSGYPLSIEHNSYDTKDEALNVCAKHFDCGGVSQTNQNGVPKYECRGLALRIDGSSTSWKKPSEFKHKKYTLDDIDSDLLFSGRGLSPHSFDAEDLVYDAGQYQYRIDFNLEPKQLPNVNLGSFDKIDTYGKELALYYKNGDSFLCPKERSTVIFLQCGSKYKLKYVQELQPCTYKFVVDVV